VTTAARGRFCATQTGPSEVWLRARNAVIERHRHLLHVFPVAGRCAQSGASVHAEAVILAMLFAGRGRCGGLAAVRHLLRFDQGSRGLVLSIPILAILLMGAIIISVRAISHEVGRDRAGSTRAGTAGAWRGKTPFRTWWSTRRIDSHPSIARSSGPRK
jgi:hypothetical protein